jgi:hypothetical protein
MPPTQQNARRNRERQPDDGVPDWRGIKTRCLDPKSDAFERYGGRGIKICTEWADSFEAFLAYVGRKPKGKTVDRINTNGNYEPGNVRWATRKEQNCNTHHNRSLTYNGQTRILVEWSEVTGIGRTTISRRLDIGWPLGKALGYE